MKQQFTAPFHSASYQTVSIRTDRCSRLRIRHLREFLLIGIVISILLNMAITVSAADFSSITGIPSGPSNQDTFESWLDAAGWPVASRYHGYRVSFPSWRDYHLLVYGSATQVPGNRYDPQTGQYAKLGFSYDEIEVTNSLFRDDSPDGRTQTTPWQWNELDMGQSARISWARLDERQKYFIKNSTLTYRNNSYGGMTFNQLHLSEGKTVVLAPPSWYLGFALYTNHYLPGSATDLRYATFNGMGAGKVSLTSSITMQTAANSSGCYMISSNADHVDINYSVSGKITAFGGLARESDIQVRGAGNDQGWVSGSGLGPWQKNLTFRVTRKDMNGLTQKQFKLYGKAWVVSKMGDLQLSRVEKTITVKAETAAPAFAVKAEIMGSIHYFSGQTNSNGQTMPNDPHRFLAMERMNIIMDFTREPQSVEVIFNGEIHNLTCSAGVRHYETSLIIPRLQSTLTWDGQRIRPPLSLKITAQDRSSPAIRIVRTFPDIELTGSVFDIVYAQIGSR